jgi:transcriptional regulator
MHPNSAFDWADREAMLEFVTQVSFATIVVLRPEGPALVHAPVIVHSHDRLRFHLSRRNGAAISGSARAIVSVLGAHAYVSPDWYGTADQVPTWNYVTVECGGALTRLPNEELAPLLDTLSAAQEDRIADKRPWTRDKMSDGRFDAMCRAIAPYELTIDSLRGTRKLGQNKSAGEVDGACASLRALGQSEMAALMARERG